MKQESEGSDPGSALQRAAKGTQPPRNFSCPHCDKYFRDNFNLNIHMGVHRKAMEGKTEVIKCNHCGKMLRSLAAYRSHIKTHGLGMTSEVMRLAEEQLSEEDTRDEEAEPEEHSTPAPESLSAWAEYRCYICEIMLGSVSFYTHMQWHGNTIIARSNDIEEKLRAYMRTLERADSVLRDIKWTIR